MEIWKIIPRFSRYEASTFGSIRSTNYKNSGLVKNIKPSITGGYFKTMLQSDDKKYKSWNVHKFIAVTFLDKIEGKNHVNHKDCNKLNNNINNLEWCTNQENIQHAYDNGLIKPKVGSANGMAKLNEDQVKEIRLHAKNNGRNYGRKALSEKFKVSECTIKEIVTRRKNKFYNVAD